MNIKAIVKNIRTKGLSGTWAIYKKRHQKGMLEEYKVEIEAMKKEIKTLRTRIVKLESQRIEDEIDALFLEYEQKASQLPLDECIRLMEAICQKASQLPLDELRKGIYEKVSEIEKIKGYKTAVKIKYIKHILPETYDLYKKEPIVNNMVFMQPRKGLNQSCRYIYKYIEKENKYKPILFELDRDNVPVTQYYLNAIEWIKVLATAKACFVHESNDLLGYVDVRAETKIVQLWHGCGVLKKIGLSTADKQSFKSMKAYHEFPEYNKYDIVTIASPELSWVFEEFMGISKESNIIQPIGVSRTDEFFDKEYLEHCYRKIHEKIPASKDKKIILYAPTYRGVGQERVAPNKLDVAKFAEALGDEHILIFKQHQTAKNIPAIPEEYKDKFAYDMTRGKGMNINELMAVADICISDYSSLVFEYALFERPMIFFAYDLEEYIDDRGLYYDFDEITPGPICRTNDEMIDYIKNIDTMYDKQEVIDFKNKFMCSCDGHSTERILQWIEQ